MDGIKYKIGGSVHINDFALDEKYHGVSFENMDGNMSGVLLLECLMRIENIQNNHVGFSFVTLCSTNEGYKLYERNGFEKLEADMTVSPTYGKEFQAIPMYLPLGVEE